VEAATHLLGMLAAANDVAGNLDHSEFYNDALNNEDFNVKEDFRRWKMVGLTGLRECGRAAGIERVAGRDHWLTLRSHVGASSPVLLPLL
jgi:hypothetical protein